MNNNTNRKYNFIIISLCILSVFSIAALIGIVMKITSSDKSVAANASVEQSIDSDNTQQSLESEPSTQATPVSIDICMVGDILVHETVYNMGLQSDGSYNFDNMFTHISDDIKKADISIVNQETILGGTALTLSAYPRFNSPQEIGDAEVKAGFNIVLHATNHTFDIGEKGLKATLDFWEDKYPDVAALGIYRNSDDASEIYVYEKNGFKVAILNYTYGTNGLSIPASSPYEIKLLDDETTVKNEIIKAKSLADMVIVCPHWGTEYSYTPSTEQDRWTNVFLESGVDIVIGTHPHVLQPVKMLTSDTNHQMLVYYSLGNCVSWQNEIPRMLGGMAKITVTKQNGVASIEDYSIEPLVTHLAHDSSYSVYKLSEYTDKLAKVNCITNYESTCEGRCNCGASQLGVATHGCASNFSVSYCKKLCKYILKDMYDY